MMSSHFSEIEILNIAIGIERRGIAFYEVLARSTENEETRHTLQHLAQMEREHLKTFQSIPPESDAETIPEKAYPEYAEYLRALVDNAVFTDTMADSEMAQVESTRQALELAIAAEKDSILFYYEMRDIVPERIAATVNRIITEEKAHLQQLSRIKKGLEGG